MTYIFIQQLIFILFLVHGGWSQWGDWSLCTKTCNQGTQTRARECNDPEPQYGGDDCVAKGTSNSEGRICDRPACRSRLLFVQF